MNVDFWEIFWAIWALFIFAAYLSFLFVVVVDLIGNSEIRGWAKAVWALLLFFVPLLSVSGYLIVHGPSMAQRHSSIPGDRQAGGVAQPSSMGSSAADQIGAAKTLLDGGVISEAEFQQLKEHAIPERRRPAGQT